MASPTFLPRYYYKASDCGLFDNAIQGCRTAAIALVDRLMLGAS